MEFIFKSPHNRDTIIMTLNKELRIATMRIKCVEIPQEHVQLVLKISSRLKYMNVKWIEFDVKFGMPPIIPPNTISYIGNNGNFVCHIEDFVRFHFANIKNVIKCDNIYYKSSARTVDGWTEIPDHRKAKKEKYIEIIGMINTLSSKILL